MSDKQLPTSDGMPPIAVVAKRRSAATGRRGNGPVLLVTLVVSAFALGMVVLGLMLSGDDSEEPDPGRTSPASSSTPADDRPPERVEEPEIPTADSAEPLPIPDTKKLTDRHDGVEVTIRSVKIGVVPAAGGLSERTLAIADPDAESLLIVLEIRNVGTSGDVRYFGFGQTTPDSRPAALTDDRSNRYRQKTLLEDASAKPPAKARVPALTEKNFSAAVLQAKEPVVVQFWADWNEDCKELTPVIDHLAVEYAGLVRVGRYQVENATQPERFNFTPVVKTYGVDLVPSVLIFHQGKLVAGFGDEIHLGGMEAVLDRLLPQREPEFRSIEIGAVIEDILVFEPPGGGTKSLRLELPGAAVGRRDDFTFEIPHGEIVKEPR